MAKDVMRIDFGGVEKEIRKGGRSFRFPEGDYLFKVVKHEVRKTKDGSGRWISWQFQCVSPKYKGKTIYHGTSLKPEALWNLRNLIFACLGKNVAGKAVNFNPTTLYGKIFAGTTEDDEYEHENKDGDVKVTVKSVLADIRPQEELGDEEDDDEDEDEDEEDDEEIIEEDDDDEDEAEDEDEDEDPVPAKKKRSASGSGGGKKKGKKKSKASDDDDEDLEEVDVEDI